jgi:hypothetical protein
MRKQILGSAVPLALSKILTKLKLFNCQNLPQHYLVANFSK